RAAEPGENGPGDHRLDLEEEEGGEERGQRVQHARASGPSERARLTWTGESTRSPDAVERRQSVGLENSPPRVTSPHGAPCASQLNPMCAISECWSRKSRWIGYGS